MRAYTRDLFAGGYYEPAYIDFKSYLATEPHIYKLWFGEISGDTTRQEVQSHLRSCIWDRSAFHAETTDLEKTTRFFRSTDDAFKERIRELLSYEAHYCKALGEEISPDQTLPLWSIRVRAAVEGKFPANFSEEKMVEQFVECIRREVDEAPLSD